MKKIIICCISVVLFWSCHKDKSQFLRIIYKTKGDYFNNAICVLNDDKSKISAYADFAPKRYRLSNNYILAGDYFMPNKNAAFLIITQEELYATEGTTDTLEKYILDKDPFIERYSTYDYNERDTARINEIIRNGELYKYFKRIE